MTCLLPPTVPTEDNKLLASRTAHRYTAHTQVGNYYAFKYCCRSRAEKYERKNMAYACLAYTMREGSLWIIIAARLSAIPG